MLHRLQALLAAIRTDRAAQYAFHFSTKKRSALLLPAGERFVIDPYSEGMLLSETEVNTNTGRCCCCCWNGCSASERDLLTCCCCVCARHAIPKQPNQLVPCAGEGAVRS